MFASEQILLNDMIAVLELTPLKPNESQQGSRGCKWAPRDFIFTDRSLYIFAEMPCDKQATPPTANYLNCAYGKSPYLLKSLSRADGHACVSSD